MVKLAMARRHEHVQLFEPSVVAHRYKHVQVSVHEIMLGLLAMARRYELVQLFEASVVAALQVSVHDLFVCSPSSQRTQDAANRSVPCSTRFALTLFLGRQLHFPVWRSRPKGETFFPA